MGMVDSGSCYPFATAQLDIPNLLFLVAGSTRFLLHDLTLSLYQLTSNLSFSKQQAIVAVCKRRRNYAIHWIISLP
ncbi:uncharacterized protein EURHEDRAFT_415690 [Aspergillus ruber CBS 135680]|uniref:Uncharacterized protein n=1 Tax=Aspergillus ruber (strain CBS 135680) TaxID=1388766 RepID=A0A017S5Y3_ASPRC|nr:uncharacterized protein EURHEDRAFT_415690 [Aspergillus ruber CBS 135680]EYE92266.1 hypothetical protein EURHEDRAFT_415690 [Aspergillus ruber CBS 135680]